MRKPLRVLMLEDSEADAERIASELDRAGLRIVTERVDTHDAYVEALREFAPDVVLSDKSLAAFDATAAAEALRTHHPVAPLIVVASTLDERTVVSCLRAGVEDVMLKRDLSRLPDAIEDAVSIRRGLGKLSPRQLQVLRLVAEGHTTKEIARRLRLSVKTIETHRGELMKRLAIHDLVGVVRYAVRVGLVPRESRVSD